MRRSFKNNRGIIIINTVLLLLLISSAFEIFSSHANHRIIHETGEKAIWLLILTLAVTPLTNFIKIKGHHKVRKTLGIYSFLFCALHLGAFLADREFSFSALVSEFYLLIGSVAFLLLAILAITSNRKSIRTLGKYWKKLHLSVYAIGALSILHVLLIDDELQPHNLVYALLFTILMLLRTPFFKKARQSKSSVNAKQSKRRSTGNLLASKLIIFGVCLVFVISAPLMRATAGEKYTYDKNHGIFTTWFMPLKITPVTHEATNRYCNDGCHWTILPGLLPKASWEKQMNNLKEHYGETIQLDPETRQEIGKYLIENAAEYSESKISVKILDSLSEKAPIRFSEIPYIAKRHHDIKEAVYEHPSIRSLSNCPACHQDVESSGDFDEKHVEIPE